jgi:hypothetical protein
VGAPSLWVYPVQPGEAENQASTTDGVGSGTSAVGLSA